MKSHDWKNEALYKMHNLPSFVKAFFVSFIKIGLPTAINMITEILV